MSELDSSVREALTRLSDRLDASGTLDGLGNWLEKHTTIEGRPWSFRDHEFQEAIANCTAPHAVIQKPSQVGLSELSFRISLALCAMKQYFGVIYTFPSAQFGRQQTKARVDPIIEGSRRLSELLVRGSDGSEMKRIGTSTWYMSGAATKTQAISRPVKGLIFDEKDFSNQSVLTSYFGRLRHVAPEDQYIRQFSTPTVSDYGINLDLMKSTKQRYMVKCEHCSAWQAPEYKTAVTIPGWDRDDFMYFTKDDLLNPGIDVDAAYLRCSHCGKDLVGSLHNPARREWVAEHPSRSIVGFEVKPFDLPKYNPVSRLVKDYGLYSDEQDYWNFVQGEVFASDSNQVNQERISNLFIASPNWGSTPLCIGIDVGARYVYAVAGFRTRESGTLKTLVPWRKRFDVRDGPFISQITAALEMLDPVCGVMDIGPDFSLSSNFMEQGDGNLHAGRYRQDDKGSTAYWELNDKTGVVSIQRTKGFNVLVKEMNAGLWEFAPGPDKATVVTHLGGMKRTSTQNEEGDISHTWVKLGDQEDHYLHACMYLKTALDMVGYSAESSVVGVLPMPSGVKLGSTVEGRLSAQPLWSAQGVRR